MSIQGARLHQTVGVHRSGAVVNDLFHDARQRVAGCRIDVYAPQVADLERIQAGHRIGRFAPLREAVPGDTTRFRVLLGRFLLRLVQYSVEVAGGRI